MPAVLDLDLASLIPQCYHLSIQLKRQGHLGMPLLPIYKYLDIRGAQLTLGNGTFKFAKPSDFNDIEDLTVQSIFPDDVDSSLDILERSFFDILMEHLDDPPTGPLPQRAQITLLQAALKRNPEVAERMRSQAGKSRVYDREFMRRRAVIHLQWINDFMQGFRVFCVTTHNDSPRMWAEYAEDHRGVMLRIEPDYDVDSIYGAFRPVQYLDARPPLYDDTKDFITESLFGEPITRVKSIVEKIIYSKTRQWEHEAEYRLAVPILDGERSWNVLPYRPHEITELYFGAAMTIEDRADIIVLAQERNPNIALFQAYRAHDGTIRYEPAG